MKLSGKVAIVTGGGGPGIGRAVSRHFASLGAAVVVADIDVAGGHETVRQIEAQQGRAIFLRTDVVKTGDIRELFATSKKIYGGVDILVNNASAPYRPEAPLEHWGEPLLVDLVGPMTTTMAAIKAMRARGGGAIVNVGSTSTLGHGRKHSGSPGYDIAKAGVIRMTTTLARLAVSDNIRVNCLVPDWVATPEVNAYWETLTPGERRERDVPDVLLTLDQIAQAVERLATDESLAGRVMVCWCGQPPRLIPAGDQGYERLEELAR